MAALYITLYLSNYFWLHYIYYAIFWQFFLAMLYITLYLGKYFWMCYILRYIWAIIFGLVIYYDINNKNLPLKVRLTEEFHANNALLTNIRAHFSVNFQKNPFFL